MIKPKKEITDYKADALRVWSKASAGFFNPIGMGLPSIYERKCLFGFDGKAKLMIVYRTM